jgi:hypothetical protein
MTVATNRVSGQRDEKPLKSLIHKALVKMNSGSEYIDLSRFDSIHNNNTQTNHVIYCYI